MSPAPNHGPTKQHFPTIIDIRQHARKISDSGVSSSASDEYRENYFPIQEGNVVSSILSLASCSQTPDHSQSETESLTGMSEAEMSGSAWLRSAIIDGLTPPVGQLKRIPTVVLYDDKGLQIYDKITYLEEYYLVQEEIDILEADSDNIVDLIPDGSVVVELGSGSLRKTRVLLDALERRRENIQYFALDLMRDELTKSLVSLNGYKNVKTAGLWGTYDEGMTFISSFPPDVPKTLLWLGSSIGNMTRAEAADFIANYRSSLNVGDNWLIGIDRRNSPKDITLAYNDPSSVTRDFIMNGLNHVNTIFQQPFCDPSKFTYFGCYNEEIGRHEAYYQALESHELVYIPPTTSSDQAETLAIFIKKGELINVEYSYKWSLAESSKLFQDTKMAKIGQWPSPSKRYDLHMLRKVPFFQACRPANPTGQNANLEVKTLEIQPNLEITASSMSKVHVVAAKRADTPSSRSPISADLNSVSVLIPEDDWNELWSAWDLVTMEMISHPGMLQQKPIDLRHPFIFYIGHIPAFLDIHVSRAFGLPLTEPSYFAEIFERGIDPDVEDSSKCHEHSKVPDNWPAVSEIISYRNTVREKLNLILRNHEIYSQTCRRARILFMTFEHQAMHLETILYMLVQSDHCKPPRGIRYPWAGGATCNSKITNSPASWIAIDPSAISPEILTLGHDDKESEDEQKSSDLTTPFGWDNENPRVTGLSLPKFEIQTRQVTNGEYLKFLEAQKINCHEVNYPKSWRVTKGLIYVRSVFGPVPMKIASSWPVSCSQREALDYIKWVDPEGMTYALPTEHQLSVAFKLKQSGFNNLMHCNYGFRAWYPLPSLSGHTVDNTEWAKFQGPGALWDWTSTQFGPLNSSYATSEIYPGYSSDFFEGNHFVVLGASWATHPRIAERRSFRNWYQGNYEYAFIGFRMVRNISD